MPKRSRSALALVCVLPLTLAQTPEMAEVPAAKCTIGDTVSHEEVHQAEVAFDHVAHVRLGESQSGLTRDLLE